jgi:hypothetical protein
MSSSICTLLNVLILSEAMTMRTCQQRAQA